MKITLEIDNISEAQATAIEDLLALWQELGGKGASRWTAFFADGDGSFQPQITIDGQPAKRCNINIGPRWGKVKLRPDNDHEDEVYFMDFDRVALAQKNTNPDDQKAS